MSQNKDTTPTIEESMRLIEEKLSENKTNKKRIPKQVSKQNKEISTKTSSLPNLFKGKTTNEKNKTKIEKTEDVLLLTKKVDKKGKILDVNKIKKEKKDKKGNKNLITPIANHKILSKTGDMALIINKLKIIRDKKVEQRNNKKNPKKINKEIKKLNETISLAEELFKKEFLEL
jgi:hypothetical protein